MFVALAAISFASCGNKAQTTTTNDSDSVSMTDSANQDSTQTDSATTDSVKADSVKA